MNEDIDADDEPDEDSPISPVSDEVLESAGRSARHSFFFTILGGSGCC